jgi:tetratricopeptide (TPR) repeat protein
VIQKDLPEAGGKAIENQADTPGEDSAQDKQADTPGEGSAQDKQEDTPDEGSAQGNQAEQENAEGEDKKSTADDSGAGHAKKPRRVRRVDAGALYNEGIKLYVAGNLGPAKNKFRAALKAKSSYAAAYRGLGMVYQRQGKKKQAADAYRKYLRLAPNASDKKTIEKQLAAMGG